MKWLKRIGLGLLLGFVALIVALNIWGLATQGTITPDPDATRDPAANRVVLVSGATGSVGDSLLNAVLEAPEVEKIHVITRRSSPRYILSSNCNASGRRTKSSGTWNTQSSSSGFG